MVTNAAGDTLLSEGVNPFFNNGQGALQPFASPEWNVYSFTPYCGDNCEPFTYGCTDESAQNYNANVNTENNSCYYAAGCFQAGYLEYYTQGYEADFDDGSCETLAVFGCMDEEASNYNEGANVDNEGCIPVVEGCMNPLAFNFNPVANTDDESCIPFIYGCIDPTMFNYNEEANTEDGSCIAYVYGCTDSSAFNYDPLATADNNTCEEVIIDCMNLSAVNYNAEANTPDNSCYYSAGCVSGDTYYLPNDCFEWVISVDPYCCDNTWDSTCTTLYDYCEDGWNGPLTVNELRDGKISFYPNPTSGIVNIAANFNVDAVVYNSSGKKIVNIANVNMLDLSKYSNGIYYVMVSYNEFVIHHKIIKN